MVGFGPSPSSPAEARHSSTASICLPANSRDALVTRPQDPHPGLGSGTSPRGGGSREGVRGGRAALSRDPPGLDSRCPRQGDSQLHSRGEGAP